MKDIEEKKFKILSIRSKNFYKPNQNKLSTGKIQADFNSTTTNDSFFQKFKD